MKCQGRTSLTVPVHHGKDLAPGTLRGLIGKSGFSVEEFVAEL
jgi:predicted RNA binding protein YcfA (HicA-like mRNA interferase family)